MKATSLFRSPLLIGLAILSMPLAGMAAITANTSADPSNIFQQTLNNPCVIGDPSCKEPGGMTYFSSSGPTNPYDFYSPSYQATLPFAGFGGNLIPTAFKIGVDDNFSNTHETLVAFNTYVCTGTAITCGFGGGSVPPGVVLPAGYALDGANSFTGPLDMSANNNGNGFSDFTLNGFSLAAGKFYVFEAKVDPDFDGMEEFFLIQTPIPEPSSVLVVCGFIAAGAIARRRKLAQLS